MSEKHKTIDRALKNYFKQFFLLISAVSGFTSIPVFTSLVGVLVGITNPSVRLRT